MERISYQDIPKGMFEKLHEIENYINDCPLDLKLLELMRLRVAQLNICAYCVDMHYKELKQLGETELRISGLVIWKNTPYFTKKEIAMLTLTEALSKTGETPVTDTTYALLTAHFSKDEICFLTLAIAQINTWTKLMKTFEFTPGNYQVQG